MLRGGLQVQKTSGLLPISYVCANLPDRNHVLDLLLDQTRGRAGTRYARSDQPADPLHATCQQPKISAPRLLY